jgi:protein-disulfide isomerase
MAKKRTISRQQRRQRDKLLMYGGMGIVVLIIVGFIIFTLANRPPEVSASRLAVEPVIGEEDAPVTIYEYGAYTCHSCRQVHQSGINDQVNELVEQYNGQVRFVFVNAPIISPTNVAKLGAEAAQCALDQGNDAFWTFHNAIYDLSDNDYVSEYGEKDAYVRLGNAIGIDGDAIGDCLDHKTHRRTVNYHEDRAKNAGVNATPAFFVNGRRVNTRISDIENAVISALSS